MPSSSKFLTESTDEQSVKIGQYLVKILTKYDSLVFWGHMFSDRLYRCQSPYTCMSWCAVQRVLLQTVMTVQVVLTSVLHAVLATIAPRQRNAAVRYFYSFTLHSSRFIIITSNAFRLNVSVA